MPMLQSVQFSPSARDQLANLYNAYTLGRISRFEYQQILEWLDRCVVKPINAGQFLQLGKPFKRFLGLMKDKTTRVISSGKLSRFTLQVTGILTENQEVVLIDEIFIKPPL